MTDETLTCDFCDTDKPEHKVHDRRICETCEAGSEHWGIACRNEQVMISLMKEMYRRLDPGGGFSRLQAAVNNVRGMIKMRLAEIGVNDVES